MPCTSWEKLFRSGEDNDLSALGCDIYDWQELTVKVRDKQADIIINGELAFSETFKEDFGNITGLIYIFEGKGSIDYVKLEDTEGKVVFEDGFERDPIMQKALAKPLRQPLNAR